MNDTLSQLAALYSEYLSEMERLNREHSTLRGAFSHILGGSSSGIGSDSCNDRFSDGVKKCIEQFAEGRPSCDETIDVFRFVMRQDHISSCVQSARLMLQAVHVYLIPLAELLSADAATELYKEYKDLNSRESLLPVQKQLVKALKNKKS